MNGRAAKLLRQAATRGDKKSNPQALARLKKKYYALPRRAGRQRVVRDENGEKVKQLKIQTRGDYLRALARVIATRD